MNKQIEVAKINEAYHRKMMEYYQIELEVLSMKDAPIPEEVELPTKPNENEKQIGKYKLTPPPNRNRETIK